MTRSGSETSCQAPSPGVPPSPLWSEPAHPGSARRGSPRSPTSPASRANRGGPSRDETRTRRRSVGGRPRPGASEALRSDVGARRCTEPRDGGVEEGATAESLMISRNLPPPFHGAISVSSVSAIACASLRLPGGAVPAPPGDAQRRKKGRTAPEFAGAGRPHVPVQAGALIRGCSSGTLAGPAPARGVGARRHRRGDRPRRGPGGGPADHRLLHRDGRGLRRRAGGVPSSSCQSSERLSPLAGK